MATSKHFMVMLFGDFFQRLEIPPKFVKHIEKALGKLKKGPIPVKIVGPTGRTWDVFIERAAGRTHFTSGWSMFARDHMLKENEVLVFYYDGSEQFFAIIFDETMCERATRAVPMSDDEGASGLNPTRSKTREITEKSIVLFKEKVYDEEDDEEEDDNDDYATYHSHKKPKKRGASSSLNSPPHPSCSGKRMEGLNAAEAAFNFMSKKPHFMKRMTTTMVQSVLRFPTSFSKDHLPQETTEFILKNSVGEEWIGSYTLERSNGKMGRGWTRFAYDNNIEIDDYCVFELVERNVFHIHIFRYVN